MSTSNYEVLSEREVQLVQTLLEYPSGSNYLDAVVGYFRRPTEEAGKYHNEIITPLRDSLYEEGIRPHFIKDLVSSLKYRIDHSGLDRVSRDIEKILEGAMGRCA